MQGIVRLGGYGKKNLQQRLAVFQASDRLNAYELLVGVFVWGATP